MKTPNKAAILVLLLSICLSAHTQVPQTNLNQIGLLKQFLGFWRCDVASDTVCFYNAELYGTGFEGNIKYVTKGETTREGKYLLGHDKVSEKFIYAITLVNNNSVKTDTFIRVSDVKEYPEGSRQNPKRNFPPEI